MEQTQTSDLPFQARSVDKPAKEENKPSMNGSQEPVLNSEEVASQNEDKKEDVGNTGSNVTVPAAPETFSVQPSSTVDLEGRNMAVVAPKGS